MATWFEITFTGEPTEADFARVAELAAQGCTSGQLINEPVTENRWRQNLVGDPYKMHLSRHAEKPQEPS